MRKKWKYMVAAWFAVIGLAFVALSFCLVGFDVKKFSTEPPYIEKEYTVDEKIDRIVVQVSNVEVLIAPSTTEGIYIEYNENEREGFEFAVTGTQLRIGSYENREWYHYICNMQFEHQYIKIYVPVEYSGQVVIDTSNCNVSAKDLTLSTLAIDTSNEKVKLQNVSVATSLSVNSRNGRLNMQNVTVAEDITCYSSNDSLSLSDVSAKSMKLESKNGSIRCEDVAATDDIEMSASSATVKFSKLSVGTKLKCTNKNGGVSGTVVGDISDFTVDTTVKNGECNIPEGITNGPKQLELYASSGDITITFAK